MTLPLPLTGETRHLLACKDSARALAYAGERKWHHTWWTWLPISGPEFIRYDVAQADWPQGVDSPLPPV